MAISFKKYVDITSGVGGGSGVRQRDLVGRIFTTNPLLPPASFIEFNNAADVGTYFGTTSDEYLRAAFYFGWVSKNITAAKKISFARWVDAPVAPRVYGAPSAQALASWTSISDGVFSLTLGATTNSINALDFTGAASLAAVAAIIQTEIRTNTGTMWTNATCTYDATRQSFNIVGGDTGAAAVAIAAGTGGTDIAGQAGWLATNAIFAAGAAAETVTATLQASADASDNFGSFNFIKALTIEEVTEAATWNDVQNVKFIFCTPTIEANAQDYYDALNGFSGTAVTISPLSTQFPEIIPMIILAATDYSRRNSVVNYMYQRFPSVTPSVTTTLTADELEVLRANFYGRTQNAGQFIDFYQRGVMMGGATDPVDQNVYANEIWLKDNAGARIMELLLSLGRVSANAQGRSQVLSQLQATINLALFNGTISVGKPLNETQKLYIADQTGDDLAYLQVQNVGYWVDAVIQSYVTVDSRTEFKIVYTLIYSKDDAVRKVDGSHILV